MTQSVPGQPKHDNAKMQEIFSPPIVPCRNERDLSTHRDTHWLAPLADAVAASVVDSPVGPMSRRGRKGLGVGVAENLADGEVDEAFPVAAIELELALVEVGSVAAPIPGDPDVHVAKNGVDGGRERGVIRAGLVGVLEAERRADGGIVVRIDFDLPNERPKAGLDSRRDRRRRGGKAWWVRGAGPRGIAAIAQKRLPAVPLFAAAREQFLD